MNDYRTRKLTNEQEQDHLMIHEYQGADSADVTSLQQLSRTRAAVLFYVAVLAVVELTGVLYAVVPAMIGHAVLTWFLLSRYLGAGQAAHNRIFPALAVLSLTRLLSFAMPLRDVPHLYWHVLIGLPVLVAVVIAVRFLHIPYDDIGLRFYDWLAQLIIAGTGIPLGISAYLILRPKVFVGVLGLDNNNSWYQVVIGSLILVLFSGLLEEVLFRGLLQRLLLDLMGQTGLIVGSLLFGIMYIGSQSLVFVLFMTLVGLFFGWCVQQTKSLWGVIAAHSLLSIGLILIWPVLW